MIRFLRVAAGVLICCLVSATMVQAGTVYQIDDGNFTTSMNVSDTSETRDNWIGNIFTIQAGAEKITDVYFQATSDVFPMTVGIYKDNGDATPPQAATLVYQQTFTPTASTLNDLVLSTPVVFAPGDKMVVGVLISQVPGSKYPYAISAGTNLGRSDWDRNYSTALGDPTDYPMSIGDISKAVPTSQALIPTGWVPSNDSCNTAGIRAYGVAVPEPGTLALLAAFGVLGGFWCLRRR
jgi:hypothetical protein